MNAPASPSAASSSRGTVVLAFVLIGFVCYVLVKSADLPAVVATHFDFRGKANGWMTRSKHLYFTLALGTLTPLFIVGVFAFVRRRQGWGLNIPNKEYWLAPERRAETFDYLSRQGLWLATLMAVFQAAIYKSILDANKLQPPTLATPESTGLVIGLLVMFAIWVAGLLLRFRKPRP
jgi:uncharacterized membrane protein